MDDETLRKEGDKVCPGHYQHDSFWGFRDGYLAGAKRSPWAKWADGEPSDISRVVLVRVEGMFHSIAYHGRIDGKPDGWDCTAIGAKFNAWPQLEWMYVPE